MENIGIVGDLHFGIRNNNEKYLEFQRRWFREELSENLKTCNSVVFLGDIFDNRTSLSPLILREVKSLFKDLCKNIKVYCILGNHDIFYNNTRDIHSHEILEDQGVIVFKDITEYTINDKKCLFLPWLVKSDIDKVKSLLANFKYDLCFGHLEINGFHLNKGTIETNGFQRDLFLNCRKVFSGHFHLKNLSGNIKYTGTPYELDWGDYLEEKGMFILDTEEMEETFIPSINTPKHIKIKSEELLLENVNSTLIQNNFIDLEYSETIKDSDRIKIEERIENLKPITFIHHEKKKFEEISEKEIESNIKDALNSLKEYVKIQELPENLKPFEKDIFIKLEELYSKNIK